MSKKHVVALRAFNHDGESFAADSVHFIETGHFDDWSAPDVDLVRAATADEISAAKDEGPGDAAPPVKSPRKASADKA
jgi:hypothetical protein